MKREVCASWEKMPRWRFFHSLFDTLNWSCNSGLPRYWLPRDVNMWETTCLYLFTLGHFTFLINVWHVVQFMISVRKIRSVRLYINYINYALSPRLSRRLVPGSFEHPLLHSLLLVRYHYREMRSALALNCLESLKLTLFIVYFFFRHFHVSQQEFMVSSEFLKCHIN